MNNKLRYFMLLIILAACLNGMAQTGLEINKMFNGAFASDTNVTETLMTGNTKFLRSHKLTVLATFKGPASTYQQRIEQLVLADGAKAIGKNVRYKEGKLYFALFVLKPISTAAGRMNRYIYYLNNAANKGSTVMVIYLEGSLKENEVADFIRSLSKQSK